MSSPILLILGAGQNVGASVAKIFAAKGYQVALASRSAPSTDSTQQLHVPVDLTKPESVPSVFETVKEKLGAAPSVVVYNAAAMSPDNPSDPLSTFSLPTYTTHTNVNHNSVLLALQQSILGFRSLPSSASKTFIFTGNFLNVVSIPSLLFFGVGKNATSYAIKALVEHKVYSGEGISIYFADERKADGGSAGRTVDGDAHAEEYIGLAEKGSQGPWLHTFVKGAGYKDFEAKL